LEEETEVEEVADGCQSGTTQLPSYHAERFASFGMSTVVHRHDGLVLPFYRIRLASVQLVLRYHRHSH